MSRKTYSGANINWGSFDEWSTAVSSDSNTSIATAMGNMFPANTSPFSASELANSTIFKGTIQAQTGGSVSITAPYTVAATGGSITVKNVFLNAYNITIVAAATYPWTFNSWRSLLEPVEYQYLLQVHLLLQTLLMQTTVYTTHTLQPLT